jgi:hypothetical protein
MERRSQLPATFTLILTLLIGALAVSLLPMSATDVAATATGCQKVQTPWPHLTEDDTVVRVHGYTDCRNIRPVGAVSYVDVYTELWRNGNFADSDDAHGTTYARTTVDRYCPTSGSFQGKSSHVAVINGKWFYPYTISATKSLSC